MQELCVGSESYIRNLEFKLRPHERIGWNTIKGGEKTPPMTPYMRKKIGDANRKVRGVDHGNYGKVRSEKTKLQIQESKRGALTARSKDDIVRAICIKKEIFYTELPNYIKNIIFAYRNGNWQKKKTIESNIKKFCEFMDAQEFYQDMLSNYLPDRFYYGVSRWA
jgi:hypothetical protein